MGQLKDFIVAEIKTGLLPGNTADSIIEKIEEVATDFLLWHIERDIHPEDDHLSIYELWEQFKIEREL